MCSIGRGSSACSRRGAGFDSVRPECSGAMGGLGGIDKSENPEYPHSIPDYVLPTQHRPKHHKPDLIRAVGYTLNPQGKLVKDLIYRGQRQNQIIEC